MGSFLGEYSLCPEVAKKSSIDLTGLIARVNKKNERVSEWRGE